MNRRTMLKLTAAAPFALPAIAKALTTTKPEPDPSLMPSSEVYYHELRYKRSRIIVVTGAPKTGKSTMGRTACATPGTCFIDIDSIRNGHALVQYSWNAKWQTPTASAHYVDFDHRWHSCDRNYLSGIISNIASGHADQRYETPAYHEVWVAAPMPRTPTEEPLHGLYGYWPRDLVSMADQILCLDTFGVATYGGTVPSPFPPDVKFWSGRMLINRYGPNHDFTYYEDWLANRTTAMGNGKPI